MLKIMRVRPFGNVTSVSKRNFARHRRKATRRCRGAVNASVASRRLTAREFGNFTALWMYTQKAIDRTNKRGVTISSFGTHNDDFLKITSNH